MEEERSLYHIFLGIIRLHYYRSHFLFEKDGIYPGQPPLLFILKRCDGQSQKELAEKLKIAPATLNVMIRRMEKAGLLDRRQDEVDQRVSRVFLTEKGHEAFLRTHETVHILETECFANFTVEEKLIFRRLLMQMTDNLQETIKSIDN